MREGAAGNKMEEFGGFVVSVELAG